MLSSEIFAWAAAHIHSAALPARIRATALRQLREYCTGKRCTFDLALPLQGTPFQRAVWKELSRIPYGTTITYGALARRIGRPHAARAVGSALWKNPFPILLPCHRVIPCSGGMGQYAGGVTWKHCLLRHERLIHPCARKPRA